MERIVVALSASSGLDWVAAVLAILTATWIRQRKWYGYAIGMPNQGLAAYLLYAQALYGLAALMLFYFVNSAYGCYQWRKLARDAAARAAAGPA